MERVVVPVLSGVCYGCFVAAPTAWTSRAGPNDQVTTCSHCGRFLYYVV
jgi:predicted  nucleic acid-binding Zn-ribbon protein